MNIPSKVLLVGEDGKAEINIETAIQYCGNEEVMAVLTVGKDAVLKDKLEFCHIIKFFFKVT